jgi:hypothetical protein
MTDRQDRERQSDPATLVPEHRRGLVERVEEEGLDVEVKDPTGGSQLGPDEASFINPALVGSGTIMPDGTYGPPLPDPNLARVNEETSTELHFATAADEREAKDAGTTGGASTSNAESTTPAKKTAPAKKANQ